MSHRVWQLSQLYHLIHPECVIIKNYFLSGGDNNMGSQWYWNNEASLKWTTFLCAYPVSPYLLHQSRFPKYTNSSNCNDARNVIRTFKFYLKGSHLSENPSAQNIIKFVRTLNRWSGFLRGSLIGPKFGAFVQSLHTWGSNTDLQDLIYKNVFRFQIQIRNPSSVEKLEEADYLWVIMRMALEEPTW